MPKHKVLSRQQKQVEEYYIETTGRKESSGQYIVHLPFNPHDLGESYDFALKRLNSLNSKFNNNPNLYDQYNTFIQEFHC